VEVTWGVKALYNYEWRWFDIYGSLNDYDCCQRKQQSYEKKIRDTKDKFLTEDYEVFQIIKKK